MPVVFPGPAGEPDATPIPVGEIHCWRLEVATGGAAALHHTGVEERRTIRVNRVEADALVLGSRQEPIRQRAATSRGVEVARRRSGGGAVWLSPGEQVWIDVVLPAGDPLHRDDIRAAAVLVGRAWVDALGPGDLSVWEEAMTRPVASRSVCFAGVGPGEVLLGDRKLVGISQRRTSSLSRFQCVAYLRWDPAPLLAGLDELGLLADDGLRAELDPVLHDGVCELPARTPARASEEPDLALARELARALG